MKYITPSRLCVAATCFSGSLAGSSHTSKGTPYFSFGVIADIQYAPIESATNFSGSETRDYSGSLQEARRAVTFWNRMEPGLRFVAQLGDLVDGQNAGKYGQGLKLKESESERSMAAVLEELQKMNAPMYHAIGNHELYNFSYTELQERLNRNGGAVAEGGKFYFAFEPFEGWTVVMLNSYEVSIMNPQDSEGYREAERILRKHNPNDVIGGEGNVNFFEGLSGESLRYVPFNGGCGETQLQWLRETLSHARTRGNKVVVLTHVPIYHGASSWRTVTYDCKECLQVLHKEGQGAVVAVFAGHNHKGGYAVDECGIHHVTVQSPLTHGEAFGHVEAYDDRLELIGQGALPSRTLRFAKPARL